MKLIARIVSVLGILGALVVGESTAHADSQVSCTVAQVAWTEFGGGTVQINCGGAWYYAFTTAPGGSPTCPVAGAEGRKNWFSLAEAAHLSGKTVTLQYQTCSGGPGLTWVDLQ